MVVFSWVTPWRLMGIRSMLCEIPFSLKVFSAMFTVSFHIIWFSFFSFSSTA